ncbi:MAG: hypothetical protein A2Y40_00195 [Candidatus Margulisbacteria bacterium GWF2_35_9]|nr:MAG: hypothetical protein A2Y40_00195 [Candidatus Margulisbacteria bacterium GWF2_35_9]
MKKILIYLLGIIYFPMAIIWSILFGIIIGILGKMLSNFLDYKFLVKSYLRDWKYYPQKSYKQYIHMLAKERTKDKFDPFVITAIINDTKYLHPKEPFPSFMILVLTMWHLFMLPFRCAKGLIDGPIIIFESCRDIWEKMIR